MKGAPRFQRLICRQGLAGCQYSTSGSLRDFSQGSDVVAMGMCDEQLADIGLVGLQILFRAGYDQPVSTNTASWLCGF